jgi:hypothetical protein
MNDLTLVAWPSVSTWSLCSPGKSGYDVGLRLIGPQDNGKSGYAVGGCLISHFQAMLPCVCSCWVECMGSHMSS